MLNIKDVFNIDPLQKSFLILFIFTTCLSFIQLYLFKHEVFDEKTFVVLGLAISISACWVIAGAPFLVISEIFLRTIFEKNKLKTPKDEKVIKSEYITLHKNSTYILYIGFLYFLVISNITFVGYIYHSNMRNFVLVSISVVILITVFSYINLLIQNRIIKKIIKEKENNI